MAEMNPTDATFPKVEWSNFERSTNPTWIKDYLDRKAVTPAGALVNPALFPAADAVVAVANGGEAAGAVSITVDPLPGPIPAGAIIGGAAGQYVKTTAAVAAGATEIPVEATTFVIADNAVLTYQGTGRKTIFSGTLIGRTYAEEAADTPFGPAADADDIVRLVIWDNPDVDSNPEVEILRPGTLVAYNLIPGWATLSAALQAKIRATYQTIKGVE